MDWKKTIEARGEILHVLSPNPEPPKAVSKTIGKSSP
jgi:hypothetical protein